MLDDRKDILVKPPLSKDLNWHIHDTSTLKPTEGKTKTHLYRQEYVTFYIHTSDIKKKYTKVFQQQELFTYCSMNKKKKFNFLNGSKKISMRSYRSL